MNGKILQFTRRPHRQRVNDLEEWDRVQEHLAGEEFMPPDNNCVVLYHTAQRKAARLGKTPTHRRARPYHHAKGART